MPSLSWWYPNYYIVTNSVFSIQLRWLHFKPSVHLTWLLYYFLICLPAGSQLLYWLSVSSLKYPRNHINLCQSTRGSQGPPPFTYLCVCLSRVSLLSPLPGHPALYKYLLNKQAVNGTWGFKGTLAISFYNTIFYLSVISCSDECVPGLWELWTPGTNVLPFYCSELLSVRD